MRIFKEIENKNNEFIDSAQLLKKELLAIDSYLVKIKIPEGKYSIDEYKDYNSYEKLAAHIANKCIQDSCILDDLSIDKQSRMLSVYQQVLFTTEEVVKSVWQNITKLEANIKYSETFSWEEEELLALTMKQLFHQLSSWQAYEERISTARFQAWYNYKIKKVYLGEGESSLDTEISFQGIDLKSPGHKLLCERLTEMGYMFFFEAPCILLGDKKRYRRIDLVVIANNRAVIVEIDGGTHRTPNQQRDDYNRDELIRKNWTNTLRLEHSDVINSTEDCMTKIISYLDPMKGRIA